MSTARVGLAARPSRAGIGSEKVNAASTPYLAVRNFSISCCDQLFNVFVILSHSGGLLLTFLRTSSGKLSKIGSYPPRLIARGEIIHAKNLRRAAPHSLDGIGSRAANPPLFSVKCYYAAAQ